MVKTGGVCGEMIGRSTSPRHFKSLASTNSATSATIDISRLFAISSTNVLQVIPRVLQIDGRAVLDLIPRYTRPMPRHPYARITMFALPFVTVADVVYGLWVWLFG